MNRHVFMVSDGTGITAELLGNSLIAQFDNIHFEKQSLPYIDTYDKAHDAVLRIDTIYNKTGIQPLIFMTIVDPELRLIIKSARASIYDLFSTFIGPLEVDLNEKSSLSVGKTHGVRNGKFYAHRMEAVDFALNHDDGIKPQGYNKADIVLIGVSRCGKTPTCLYMALQYGILAANYPFTDEDLLEFKLPSSLRPFKEKLFGLTIDVDRLQQIRTERRPFSKYASVEQCRIEVNEVESMYRRENIPFINSTKFSIEEISTKILSSARLHRKI